jgi:hypothetical protein
MANVLIAIAILVGLAALLVATRPSTFHVERSITVAAPPERAFAQVNELRAWGAWSPWEKKDPAMQRTWEGPRAGTGAVYAWSGNKDVGEGRMTIVRSDPPSRIAIELRFFKPMKATNAVLFAFTPVAGGTRVTWTMDGRNGFVAKALHLVMDLDAMVGGDFERGLAALKLVAEGAAASVVDLAAARSS